jgi:hypothetical protein
VRGRLPGRAARWRAVSRKESEQIVNVVTAGRCVAAVITLIMVVYLAVDGAHRPDNPFLVPDVVVAVLLGVACSLPNRFASTALVFAFGWTGGVITVSFFSYVVRGEFAWSNLGIVVAAVGMAVLLLRSSATNAPASRGRVR